MRSGFAYESLMSTARFILLAIVLIVTGNRSLVMATLRWHRVAGWYFVTGQYAARRYALQTCSNQRNDQRDCNSAHTIPTPIMSHAPKVRATHIPSDVYQAKWFHPRIADGSLRERPMRHARACPESYRI